MIPGPWPSMAALDDRNGRGLITLTPPFFFLSGFLKGKKDLSDEEL